MSVDLLPVLDGAVLDRSRPLRDQLYQIIRRVIVTGLARPGDAINEVAIAKQLGISRTPVREAVKKISDEGLIDVAAQSGTYVAKLGRKQVEEAYVIRTTLELEAVRRAAERADSRHIRDLHRILEAHRGALDDGRFADAIARDDDFHRYIAGIIEMPMLWRAIDISKAQMDRCRHLAIPNPGKGAATIAQHEAIIAALALQDGEAATRAMRLHLETSHRNALELLT